MALIPDIQSTIASNISLAELGWRGSLRVTQTLARVAPHASTLVSEPVSTGLARVAQLVEQLSCKQQVLGSNPGAGSKYPSPPESSERYFMSQFE